MKLASLAVLFLISINYSHSNTCNPDKYRWMDPDLDIDWNVTVFSNFNKFSDLPMNCNQTYNISKWLQFLPNNGLIIDQSFDIEKLDTRNRTFFIEYLVFNKIIGVDITNIKPGLVKNVSNFVITTLAFYYSRIDAYSNGEKISNSQCNLKTYKNADTFFKSFFIIYLRNVFYSEICPLMFRNSYAYLMYFGDISNSFLIKNRLKFTNLNLSTDFNMNMVALTKVVFDINYDFLSENMLNKHLFKNIGELKLTGQLLGIESDLLNQFKKLREILFKIEDYRSFFHRSTKWLKNLNGRINVNLTNRIQVKISFNDALYLYFLYPNLVSFNKIYEFPDEDICLFKFFPHKHMVYPLFKPGKRINCSCTLMWLQSYNRIYEPTNESRYRENINLMNRVEYDGDYEFCNLLVKCDFKRIFDNCEITTKDSDIKWDFNFDNDVNALFAIKWLQFILLTLLQPVLASIGILNNVLIIVVVRNKNKKKEFNESMYSHMLINAAFNICYCTILLLKLVNTCLFYESQVFCSSVYQLELSQYFKIFFIFYLGNISKICSNISYLGFSFSRFTLISLNKENKFYIKFNRMNLKLYSFMIILFSSLASVFLLFQYKLNREHNFSKEFPYEIRNETFCSYQINMFQCWLFNALKIFNSVLSSVIMVILNVVIDLSLLKDYGIDIKKKLKMAFTKKKIEDLKEKKKKVNKMVLIYGSIFFFSHMPEFLTTILLISFAKQISAFCQQKLSCDLINEEAEFFNLISIVSNFFIFKKFDHNFKDSWADLWKRFLIYKSS
jgi:hypothetical protein